MYLNIIQLKVLVTFHSMNNFHVVFPNDEWKMSYDLMEMGGLISIVETETKLPREAVTYVVTDKGRALVDGLLLKSFEVFESLKEEIDIEEVEKILEEKLKEKGIELEQGYIDSVEEGITIGYDIYHEEDVIVPTDENE